MALKGNILTKGDVSGTFAYNTSGKPYAISSSSVANGIMSSATQVISYTSFKRPNAITQDGNVQFRLPITAISSV